MRHKTRDMCSCPLPGVQRGSPLFADRSSRVGKGAIVPRIVGLFVAVSLLAAIAVPSVLFATQGNRGTEARVAAYKHEDGRVEFAIQVREGDRWGERLLPRGRVLGANARTGRWLTSTPVSLPGSVSLPITTQLGYNAAAHVKLLIFPGRTDDLGLPTDDESFSFRTYVSVEGEIVEHPTGIEIETPTLYFSCRNGVFSSQVNIAWRKHPDSPVLYSLSNELGDKLRWTREEPEEAWSGPWHITKQRMVAMKDFDVLTVGYQDLGGEIVFARFEIGWALGSPVQPNLDYCGTY